MAVCGTGISSISSVDGISGVILPPTQVIIEKLAEQVEFSHLAQSLRDRISVIADLENGLTQVNSLVTTETGILAQELLALKNDLTGAVAYINEQTTVDTNARQAMVNSINTLMAQWGNRVAALEETSTVLVQDTNAMLAEKIIKTDLNGNVVGYGLSARVDPNGQFSSDFQVRADTFSIAPPSVTSSTEPPNNTLYNGKIWIDSSTNPPVTKWYNKTTKAWQTTPVKGAVPFIVKTSEETIDGITVEPGVYIDSAYVSRLRADQIDTRGLTIKDSTGKVILDAAGVLTNLAKNSSLRSGIANWRAYISSVSKWYDGKLYNRTGTLTHVINANGAPTGFGAMLFSLAGPSASDYSDSIYQNTYKVPCTPGERLELQAKVMVFRGNARLEVSYFDSANNPVGYYPVSGGVTEAIGDTAWSQNLTDFVHLWGFSTVPSNASSAYIEIRAKRTVDQFGLNTDMYVTQPYIGKATSTQVSPSAWVDSTPLITANNASTYISDAAIGSAQIGSIALVGKSNFNVKSANQGARMEMDASVIKIFDASGVLRVKLGDLSA